MQSSHEAADSSNGESGEQWARPLSSPRLVVIGASAGGVDALKRVLGRLPADFPAAIAFVQHRGTEFPERLIEILSNSTSLKVRHAQDGMPLEAGTVYVCPPGIHMVAEHSLRLAAGARLNFVRPSADLMLESAAGAYGDRAIGVVLSGAGWDGALGSLAISQAGGTVIAQEEESCAFADMPTAASNVGSSELRLPPEQIAGALQQMVQQCVPVHSDPPMASSGEAASPLRVLLADDHRVLLDGLRLLIDGEADMQVVGCADEGVAAVRRADELLPDVVVMDICMPGLDGVEATRQIISGASSAKIVALSSFSDAGSMARILQAGASGYLTKHRAFGELIQAIRSVANGKPFFSRDVAGLVASGRVRIQAPSASE